MKVKAAAGKLLWFCAVLEAAAEEAALPNPDALAHTAVTTQNIQAQLIQAGFAHVLAQICRMQSSRHRHTMDINRQG